MADVVPLSTATERARGNRFSKAASSAPCVANQPDHSHDCEWRKTRSNNAETANRSYDVQFRRVNAKEVVHALSLTEVGVLDRSTGKIKFLTPNVLTTGAMVSSNLRLSVMALSADEACHHIGQRKASSESTACGTCRMRPSMKEDLRKSRYLAARE